MARHRGWTPRLSRAGLRSTWRDLVYREGCKFLMVLSERFGRSSKSHSETKVSRHMFGSPSPCAFVCKGNVREESGKDSYDIKWTSEQATSGNHLTPSSSRHPHATTGNQLAPSSRRHPQTSTSNHVTASRRRHPHATTGTHKQPRNPKHR